MVVLAFVLPKVYEMRKEDIDRTFYTVSNETQKTYNTYVDPYVKKLPRGSTATSSSAGNSTAETQRKVENTMNEATSNVKAGVNQGFDQVTWHFKTKLIYPSRPALPMSIYSALHLAGML